MKPLSIIRTYKAENNGVYDYELHVLGEPTIVKHSAHRFDYGLVAIEESGEVNLELYRNSDSVPSMDANSNFVPITIS